MHSQDRQRILAALDHWITVKLAQRTLSEAGGRAQGETRAAVTGGQHLAGVNRLLLDQLDALGVDGLSYFTHQAATVRAISRVLGGPSAGDPSAP